MRTLGLLALLITSLAGRAADFRTGAAAAVINPAEKTPLAGYYTLRPADGVLDDLHSKTLVFEQGGEKAAVVICDLLSLPRPTVLAARELIERATGIPASRVLIAATHAHTGPVVARESSRDDLDGGSSELGVQYTKALPALIAQSVVDATQHLVPVRVLAATTHVENVAFNRRFWMADGTVAWNPPKLSPQIVAPAGPHDPELGFLHFTTLDKEPHPLAVFVNYAMHPDTTGGTRISADYPGVLAARLAEMNGEAFLALFANGTCGNLNHRNVWWSDPQHGRGETVRLGNILAGAICAAWQQLEEVPAAPLRVRSEIVSLPLPEITNVEVSEARALIRKAREPGQKFMDQVKAFRVLDVQSREGRPWEVEVQVIALGSDVAFVALPGEIFVELGLAIKAASPFKHTFNIELANGAIGYIPNKPAYAEGSYEVMSARCAAGSGEMLVNAAIKLLRELHSQ
jgi:hypothetical protein